MKFKTMQTTKQCKNNDVLSTNLWREKRQFTVNGNTNTKLPKLFEFVDLSWSTQSYKVCMK